MLLQTNKCSLFSKCNLLNKLLQHLFLYICWLSFILFLPYYCQWVASFHRGWWQPHCLHIRIAFSLDECHFPWCFHSSWLCSLQSQMVIFLSYLPYWKLFILLIHQISLSRLQISFKATFWASDNVLKGLLLVKFLLSLINIEIIARVLVSLATFNLKFTDTHTSTYSHTQFLITTLLLAQVYLFFVLQNSLGLNCQQWLV